MSSRFNRRSGSCFHFIFLSFFCSTFLFYGCDQNVKESESLSGKWQIAKAIRNGVPTTTLEDAFFDFDSDSTFITNIFSEEKSYNYLTQENGFTQLGDEQIEYTFLQRSPDTLVIETNIRKYNFIFLALKDTSRVEGIHE